MAARWRIWLRLIAKAIPFASSDICMKLRIAHGMADTLGSLLPGYFALVMATGIVAIALYEHHVPFLPLLLFALNLVFLLGLNAANILRMVRHPAYFLADIRSHSRGVGFFTAV